MNLRKTNKILIVEGLDRCGKGTFIKKYRSLVDNFSTVRFHCDAPPSVIDKGLHVAWSMRHYNAVLGQARLMWNNSFDVIFDRSHIGEFVYGKLYRKYDPDWVFDCHDKILMAEPRVDWYNENQVPKVEILVFTDSPESLWARDDGEGLSSSLEDIKKEYTRWCECITIMQDRGFPVTHVDWTKQEFSPSTIEQLARKYAETSDSK